MDYGENPRDLKLMKIRTNDKLQNNAAAANGTKTTMQELLGLWSLLSGLSKLTEVSTLFYLRHLRR